MDRLTVIERYGHPRTMQIVALTDIHKGVDLLHENVENSFFNSVLMIALAHASLVCWIILDSMLHGMVHKGSITCRSIQCSAGGGGEKRMAVDWLNGMKVMSLVGLGSSLELSLITA